MGRRDIKRAGSATLKLSRRTVMLYASRYDRAAKATRQTYVAGFSRAATEIPAAFMRALDRLATAPERREEILARIETEALAPARERAAELALERARHTALAPLSEAKRAVLRAVHCLETAEESAERDEALAALLSVCNGLRPARPIQPPGTCETPPDIDRAIAAFASACTTLTAAVQALPKRSPLKAETVNAWQRSWYAHQEMQAIATSRAALKRPAGWSRPSVRALVEQGCDARAGLQAVFGSAADGIAPGSSSPASEENLAKPAACAGP